MPAFEDERLEKLAQGLARGLPPHAATKLARYSKQTGMTLRRVAREDVAARVEEIKREKLEKAADLMPVIRQLMALAAKAKTLDTAAAMTAARGLLSEAARLKGLLKEQAPQPPTGPILPPRMSTEEWVKIFGPKRSPSGDLL